MMFIERIRQLSEDLQIPQRKMAAALDIAAATYWKIERGERRAKREHIPIIAEILQADTEKLLAFWLAGQIITAIGNEKELARKVLKVVGKEGKYNIDKK